MGEQPIAELIFSRFRDFGCRHMTMIVNYKRGMIKSYFADLEKDYTVDFIDEDVFMGHRRRALPVERADGFPVFLYQL